MDRDQTSSTTSAWEPATATDDTEHSSADMLLSFTDMQGSRVRLLGSPEHDGLRTRPVRPGPLTIGEAVARPFEPFTEALAAARIAGSARVSGIRE